jgi:hypothetical protein
VPTCRATVSCKEGSVLTHDPLLHLPVIIVFACNK